MKKDELKIFFIGGTGRSGTSILNKVFVNSGYFPELPEFRILSDPNGIIDFYNTISTIWSPYIWDAKYKQFIRFLEFFNQKPKKPVQYFGNILNYKTKLFPKLTTPYYNFSLNSVCPNYNAIIKSLAVKLNDFKYDAHWTGMELGSCKEMYYSPPVRQGNLKLILRNFLEEMFLDILTFTQKKFFLGKNPWDFLLFDRINEILPQAKFIHIYRDPRDVICSMEHQIWCSDSLTDRIKTYKDIMDLWRKVKKRLSADLLIEVKFEDLIDDFSDVFSEVSTFCNLPDDMIKERIDLSKHNIGRWKNELNDDDKNLINKELKDYIEG